MDMCVLRTQSYVGLHISVDLARCLRKMWVTVDIGAQKKFLGEKKIKKRAFLEIKKYFQQTEILSY